MLDVTVPESPSGARIATTGSPTFTDDGPSEITLSWCGVCTCPSIGISSATFTYRPVVAGHWASDRRLVCPLWLTVSP